MNFVLIAEPDELNAERIRAILETVEKDFTYELVNTAEQAIDIAENRKPDIFIGDMQMPIVTGSELFSMIEMLSPETVRIVMTEVDRIPETVAFMNECRTYKVIMKPCRVADDLLTPINASITYKEMKQRIAQEVAAADMDGFSSKQDYGKMEQAIQENLRECERVQNIFTKMLKSNLKLGRRSEYVQKRLESWYSFMLKAYIGNLMESSGEYHKSKDKLIKMYHKPKESCVFRMKKAFAEPVQPEQMNEITYILQMMTELCNTLLKQCRISVLLENTEKAYILRYVCLPGADKNGENLPADAYKEKSKDVRESLIKATEQGIDSLGHKAVLLTKGSEFIVNMALRK